MNNEAEASQSGQRQRNSVTHNHQQQDHGVGPVTKNNIGLDEALIKARRIDAKRKRMVFLEHLLRELDALVFLELITLYYLDCSFFWFLARALVHGSLLTPLPEMGIDRQQDEHKPYFPLIIVSFVVSFLLHLLYPAPSAGEVTRGYLHGGLMIDFIGQKGPTSKWKLASLDICLLLLQVVMVSMHVKRVQLKKKLAIITPLTALTQGASAEQAAEDVVAERDQDADAEERGMLRRTDSLSDVGAEEDGEEQIMLPSPQSTHVDALDHLTSGQCIIGEFTLIDTLLQEHQDYQVFRQTRTESGTASSIQSSTLRQLQIVRARFGVGGG